MQVSTTFEVPIPPSGVFAFLSNPRNLITANHEGPILERSDGPPAAGAWFVLGFDQLRARVEYTAFEPDRRLAASVVMSGRGSGGMSSRQEFLLSALGDGSATRVDAAADGDGGWLRWAPLMRASQRAAWRRMRARMVASA
jgi:carbon monoxide dehydrogenase subunit G